MNKQKEEALSRIKDPKVREHYRAQFEMEEELEQEGLRAGGIFETHGVPSSGHVTGPIEEPIFETPPPMPIPWVSLGLRMVLAVVVLLIVAAFLWSASR